MPRVPRREDVNEILKRFEARTRNVENRQQVANSTIGRGALQSRDTSTGRLLYYLGGATNSAYNKPDGTQQSVFEAWRDTGQLAMAIADFNPQSENGYQQFVGLFDRQGNIIVSDDTDTGWGLATPWLQGGHWFNQDITKWPSTTSSTFTAAWSTWIAIQQPWLRVGYLGHSDSGTTGEVQLVLNGDVVHGPVSIPAGSFSSVQVATIPIYSLGLGYGSTKQLDIQYRRTGGTGSIQASPQVTYSRQTLPGDL